MSELMRHSMAGERHGHACYVWIRLYCTILHQEVSLSTSTPISILEAFGLSLYQDINHLDWRLSLVYFQEHILKLVSFPHSLLLVYKHFFTSSVTNKIIVAGHTGLLNNALTMNHITNCTERNSWETKSWSACHIPFILWNSKDHFHGH